MHKQILFDAFLSKMRKTAVFFLVLCTSGGVFAQSNEPHLMTTTHYGELIYSSAMTWDHVVVDLTADIYEPDREGQDLRPLVILVPDAYFTSSDASYEHWDKMANYIASCGYLVANIKYRQGMDPDIKVLLEDEFVKGITRSVQDIYAAIRYFREDAINGANSYQIDPERILLLGYSSGGMAVLHAAKYYLLDASTQRVDRLIKSVGGWHFNEKTDQLQDAIRGIAVIAGGVFDTLMMANHNRTPVMLFQANEDSIVPRFFGNM